MKLETCVKVRKKFKRGFYQTLSILLCLVFTLTAFTVLAGAAEVKSIKETKYDIAVVFDNSGSMYENYSKAWCREKYAMEIFASMLNFSSGDKLTVFPMSPVVSNGTTSSAGSSINPLKINSINDIEKIHNIYTIDPGNTPYSTVTDAYDFLANKNYSKKDNCERWLIILTDGAFNEKLPENFNLDNDLKSKAEKNKVKIQYLGIGEAKKCKAIEEINLYSIKSSDTSLKDDLVQICNRIFDRVPLPNSFINGSQLEFDISMNKIIVFAQGKDAKIDSLVNSNGNAVEIIQNSGQRTYSELNASGYYDYKGVRYEYKNAKVDDTLAGQVVTFGKCPKGTYTLNCSGAENVQVFYELDVDIDCHLEDKDGNTVEINNNEILEGNYNIYYKLIDGQTGKLIDQKSELFGDKGVKLDAALNKINNNGSKQKICDISDGCLIKLEKGQNVAFDIEGTFLDRYSIKDSNIPSEIKVIPKPEEIGLEIEILQKKKTFYTLLRKLFNKEWEPIYVNVTYKNKPMDKNKLKNTEFDFLIKRVNKNNEFENQDINTNDLVFGYEVDEENSRLIIYLGKKNKDDKNFVYPDTGKYLISVEANSVSAEGKEESGKDDDNFKIALLPTWLIILLCVLLLIILFIIWYLIHYKIKVFPRGGYIYEVNNHREPITERAYYQSIDKNLMLSVGNNVLFMASAKRHTAFINRRKPGRCKVKCKFESTGPGVSNVYYNNIRMTENTEFVLMNSTYIRCNLNGVARNYYFSFSEL